MGTQNGHTKMGTPCWPCISGLSLAQCEPPRPGHQITNTTWWGVIYNQNHGMAGTHSYIHQGHQARRTPSCPGLRPCLCLNPCPRTLSRATAHPRHPSAVPVAVNGGWANFVQGDLYLAHAQGHDLQQFDAPATRWPQFYLGHVHAPKACEPAAATWTPTP